MSPLLLVALALAADPQSQAQAVEKALVTAEPRLHRCWEQAAADDFQIEGQIDLSVTVGDKGRAGKIAVKGDSIGRKPLEECVAKAFGDVTFGEAFAPGDSVEVPVTFRAESNVTLKADDAKGHRLKGAQGVAKILVDAKTARADRASLVWVDLQPGARFVRPTPQGQVFIYVRRGRSTFGGAPASGDDVVVLDDGSAPLIQASDRTELLMLFVPPGAEEAFREGRKIPAATEGGPPPRFVPLASIKRYDLPGRTGDVWVYVEKDQASVSRLRLSAGKSVPGHRHDGVAEYLYVESGSGELTIDGDRYPVTPFTAIYIPPGAEHSFTASTGGYVEAIQFYTPSGPEQRFKGSKP